MKNIKKYINEKLTISKKLIEYNTKYFKNINELLKKYDGKLLLDNSNNHEYYYECFIPKIKDLVNFFTKHKNNLSQYCKEINNDLFDVHNISLDIDVPSYGVVVQLFREGDPDYIGYLTFRCAPQKVNMRMLLFKNLDKVDIDNSFIFSCIDYLLEKYV